MLAVDELAKFLTVEEAARALDVPESRFRASWRQNGIVKPALSRGLMQFARTCVVRGAVLVLLQRIFGEQSSLALELVKTLSSEQLDQILGAEAPHLDARVRGLTFSIDLDPAYLAGVRERIAQVRV